MEEKREYVCQRCRAKHSNLKWVDKDNKIMIGYCPRCGEELSRKLKTN